MADKKLEEQFFEQSLSTSPPKEYRTKKFFTPLSHTKFLKRLSKLIGFNPKFSDRVHQDIHEEGGEVGNRLRIQEITSKIVNNREVARINQAIDKLAISLKWESLDASQRKEVFYKIAKKLQIFPTEPPPPSTWDMSPNSEAFKYLIEFETIPLRSPDPGRPKGMPIVEYLKEMYGNFLTGEFTRADLRRIDPKAEMALRNWERKNGRAPLNLPTLKEFNDMRLAESDEGLDRHEKLELQRLRATRRQNAKRPKTP